MRKKERERLRKAFSYLHFTSPTAEDMGRKNAWEREKEEA